MWHWCGLGGGGEKADLPKVVSWDMNDHLMGYDEIFAGY